MVTFNRRWLPLNALRAFDAVGRHLSFTAAANALNVSQSAVSRHVIGLEELLGHQLFERRPQSLALTKAGSSLLPSVRGAFDRIEQALNDVVSAGGGLRTLRVQLPPTFAQKMALPILQGFRKEFPDIFLDFSSLGYTGAPRTETDVAVIFDRPRTGVAISDLLWMSRLTPACSPLLAAAHEGKSLAQFVADNELLHCKVEGESPGMIWDAFSRAFDLGIKTGRGLAFDTAALAAQYAASGEGVALLDIDLFAQDIKTGLLVTPFSETFEDGYGYFLSLAAEDLADPVISVFREWMIRNFARLEEEKLRKYFFFEKKKQKTFTNGLRVTIVALPMYDFHELRVATDALWDAIAARLGAEGIGAPAALTRGRPLDALWTDPDLLLGQTCGYPLATTLKGRVTLLATPCYLAPGATGTRYRSAVVVRANHPASTLADLRFSRCAINDAASNSGMNLLRAAIAPLAGANRFFSHIVMTGSHAASVLAVAGGDADVAAIDCVTWAHLRHLRPETTAGLRVLAWTAESPGLPLITSLNTTPEVRDALRRALASVARDPTLAPVRQALRLDGFEMLTLADYDAVLALEQEAQKGGYPELC